MATLKERVAEMKGVRVNVRHCSYLSHLMVLELLEYSVQLTLHLLSIQSFSLRCQGLSLHLWKRNHLNHQRLLLIIPISRHHRHRLLLHHLLRPRQGIVVPRPLPLHPFLAYHPRRPRLQDWTLLQKPWPQQTLNKWLSSLSSLHLSQETRWRPWIGQRSLVIR